MPIKPQDQNPDNPVAGHQRERKVQQPRRYGKNALFNPEAEETQTEEYEEKETGLPKTAKYSVDKH